MREGMRREQRRNMGAMCVICSLRTRDDIKRGGVGEGDREEKESLTEKIERVCDMLPRETSKQGEKDMRRRLENNPPSLPPLLSHSSLLCSPSSQPLSLLLSCCVMLDYWKGKSPKSALLIASPLLLHSLFSHYAMLCLLTKRKMFQTLPILIKHISASVVASSFQTRSFKTTAKIKVIFFPFCCAVDPH